MDQHYGCSNTLCQKRETIKGEFLLCSRCKVVRYCSTDCQLVDWRLTHKSTCSTNQKSAKELNDFIRVKEHYDTITIKAMSDHYNTEMTKYVAEIDLTKGEINDVRQANEEDIGKFGCQFKDTNSVRIVVLDVISRATSMIVIPLEMNK